MLIDSNEVLSAKILDELGRLTRPRFGLAESLPLLPSIGNVGIICYLTRPRFHKFTVRMHNQIAKQAGISQKSPSAISRKIEKENFTPEI